MAPKRTSNPGRSTRYYRKNKASYAKKKRYQKKLNSTSTKKKYRRELARERYKRKMKGDKRDLCHVGKNRKKLKPCNSKKNRALGGGKRR